MRFEQRNFPTAGESENDPGINQAVSVILSLHNVVELANRGFRYRSEAATGDGIHKRCGQTFVSVGAEDDTIHYADRPMPRTRERAFALAQLIGYAMAELAQIDPDGQIVAGVVTRRDQIESHVNDAIRRH
jgi:hypothetical protein